MTSIKIAIVVLVLALTIMTLFGKQIEACCGGRAAYFMEPPNSAEPCLHPYLYCGVKTGGYAGENWYL